MAARKQSQNKDQLRELIHDHNIRFRGPVPQNEWPEDHKHHFEAIYSISFTRYTEYMKIPRIATSKKQWFQNCVHHLRQRCFDLLDDGSTNESTWRELEPFILARFNTPVIW